MSSISNFDLGILANNLSLTLHPDYYGLRTWKEVLTERLRNPFKNYRRPFDNFEVLKNLNFEIKKGDRVGIIGSNGTGKSTLCRCLAGIYHPTSGELVVKGKVKALFDTSVGMNPELTGRENGKLLMQFLYSDQELRHELLEDALEFSELGDFLESPFKNYSNGMKVRLSLSIASSMPAEILILDEVFAGADWLFSKKISRRILDIIESSGIVIFVSHSPELIKTICNRVLYLESGQIKFDGFVDEALRAYFGGLSHPSKSLEEMLRVQSQTLSEIEKRLYESEEKLLYEREKTKALELGVRGLENLKPDLLKLELKVNELEVFNSSLHGQNDFLKLRNEELAKRDEETKEEIYKLNQKLSAIEPNRDEFVRDKPELVILFELGRVEKKFYKLTSPIVSEMGRLKRLTVSHQSSYWTKRVNFVAFLSHLSSDLISEGIGLVQASQVNSVFFTQLDTSKDFIVSLLVNKYEFDIPVELQCHFFGDAGYNVLPVDLYHFIIKGAETISPIYEKLKLEICSDLCGVQIDYLPWRIVNEKGSRRLWVICNRVGAYFRLEEGTSNDFITGISNKFSRSYVCESLSELAHFNLRDGYKVQLCWEYLRREIHGCSKLFLNEELDPIDIIDKIIEIENKATSISHLTYLRKTESISLVSIFERWCREIISNSSRNSILFKIAEGCINSWHHLTYFLEDALVPISIKDAERALEYAIAERRHVLISSSLQGAQARAMLYSICETCKLNEVDLTEYLTYVFKESCINSDVKTPLQYAIEKYGKN